MCGIAGIRARGRDGAAATVLDAQLRPAATAARTPRGVFAGAAARSARPAWRSSTWSPATRRSPTRTATVGVALNGEIYNFRELRDELRARGHRLATHGRHRGDRPPGRGARRRRAGPAAGRACSPSPSGTTAPPAPGAGARPAGQEAPVLLAAARAGWCSPARSRRCWPHPGVPRRPRPRRRIPAYLTFGYVPTPRTFFEGVRSLPPGHVLTCERRRGRAGGALLGAARARARTGPTRLDLSLDEAATRGARAA